MTHQDTIRIVDGVLLALADPEMVKPSLQKSGHPEELPRYRSASLLSILNEVLPKVSIKWGIETVRYNESTPGVAVVRRYLATVESGGSSLSRRSPFSSGSRVP